MYSVHVYYIILYDMNIMEYIYCDIIVVADCTWLRGRSRTLVVITCHVNVTATYIYNIHKYTESSYRVRSSSIIVSREQIFYKSILMNHSSHSPRLGEEYAWIKVYAKISMSENDLTKRRIRQIDRMIFFKCYVFNE